MKAEKVFWRAMALMDSGSEETGELDGQVVEGYRKRGLAILNLLGEECAGAMARREETFQALEGYEEEISVSEELAAGAMPYGLAAHLLLEEDPAAASFFQQRYEEALARSKRKAEMGPVKPPYGGVEMGEDGRWKTWR